MKAVLASLLLLWAPYDVRYFPNILYGHILIGTAASRYETIFTIAARKEAHVTLRLFTDKAAPMEATFVDERGQSAGTATSFAFVLARERPVRIKLAVPTEETEEEVAVKTGWAVLHSSEPIDVTATVRITAPDGKLIHQYMLAAEQTVTGE